ncbi:hypothetical protein PHYPSEUDO_012109 [Phytophthora pseudosyringae]|uniref:Uncharacterized protein n=1 Tax=Phytophthora pseudosyringae TaxID=221518 RepID=A0A8T1W7D1_9STRA|nr:hypothetical protein PHYPSEUDO_012109 [Phytophthora pseudosyringae]
MQPTRLRMAEKTVHGDLELQPPPGQDANGITVGQWSSRVIPEEPEGFLASNVNAEACCPCVPLAQIEVRLGLTSYASALTWYSAAYGLLTLSLAGLWVFVALWIYSQGYRDATSVLVRVLWIVGMLVLTAIPSLLLVHRISALRSSVRERFDIPGSVREDRTAAWQETARAIRQMRRHLKIDQAKCGAVATLPAYHLIKSGDSCPMRRLDGVLPTALEGLQQRRQTTKSLQEIDKLLRDDPTDELLAAFPTTSTRGCSFGSGREPKKNPRYWLSKSSSAPGPGAYAVSKADRIVKPSAGGGGALGLRSGACCRFQPCECKKKPRDEQAETPVRGFDGKRQDTKQPRRPSPSLVVYPRPSATEPDFQTREQRRRVAAVQAAKQRWEHAGLSTTPNYRWTERRVGAGGALPLDKSTRRDGAGSSTAKARLRKLQLANRTAQKCEAEHARAATATTAPVNSKAISGPFVAMAKLSGRDAVCCRRKQQRIVTAFGA